MSDPLWQALKSAVLRHHNPQYRDELLISAADIIAADERAQAEGHPEETTKHTAPLQSILARLFDGEEHDISLFDHLRVTAAIAASLEAEGLRARNESIGGHGLRPVTEENCRKLSQTVKHLLDQAVPTWNDQVKQAQFAQLH